jgi:hypothetical protein
MKKQTNAQAMATIIAVSMISSLGFAQESITKAPEAQDTRAGIHGLRVGFVKPALDVKISTKYGSNKESIQSTNGVSVGYANVPVGGFGYIADATLLILEEDNDSVNLLRLSGSAATGLNSVTYLKGGLNISKFTTGESAIQKFDPNIGLQVGLGFQASKNLGFEVGYSLMRQQDKIEGVKVDLTESGVELGITGTF